MNVEKVKLSNPVGKIFEEDKHIAERPDVLEGKTLGLLDNGKEFSDIIVKRVGEVLEKKYKLKNVVLFEKGYPAKAAPFIEKMVDECDFVVNGVGH
jgi:hypothetical protein